MNRPFICMLLIVLGETSVAQESRRVLLTGQIFDDTTELRKYPVSYFGINPNRNYDLSRFLPPTGQQGDQASCVSWVVGYGLLGFLKAQASNKPYSSTSQAFEPVNQVFGSVIPDIVEVFSPAYLYNLHQHIYGRQNCLNGMKFIEAFKIFNQYGCPPYVNYPYTTQKEGCGVSISKKALNATLPHNNRLVFNTVIVDRQQIKAQLAAKRIVLVGLMIDDKLKSLKDSIWSPSKNLTERHAVICAAYQEPYFKMMNSWGTNFGHKGYFYIHKNNIDTTLIKQLFVAEYLPNSLPRASFGKPSNLPNQLGTGQFVTGNRVKYELVEIEKDSTAIITALYPVGNIIFSFRIKPNETKAVAIPPNYQQELYFTYKKRISGNNIEVDFKQPTEQLIEKDRKPAFWLIKQVINPIAGYNKSVADSLEKKAFENLDKGKLEEAINYFRLTDLAYPEYHSAYEAANRIRIRLNEFGDNPTFEQKEEIKREIKSTYWFGIERDDINKIDTPIQNE